MPRVTVPDMTRDDCPVAPIRAARGKRTRAEIAVDRDVHCVGMVTRGSDAARAGVVRVAAPGTHPIGRAFPNQ